MGMPDPIPTFTGLVTHIRDSYPEFAYIHIIEATDIVLTGPKVSFTRPPVNFLRDVWGDRPYIANASYERDTAMEAVEKEGSLVLGATSCRMLVSISHIPWKRVLIGRF